MPTTNAQQATNREACFDPQELAVRLASAQSPPRAATCAAAAGILIVDSSEAARRAFCEVLKKQGYEVTCAAGAAEAAEYLAHRPFDLLLCDIGIPGHSTLPSLIEVSHAFPDMAVVLTTILRADGANARLPGDPSRDLITKPCNQVELTSVIQRNLTRRALQRKHSERFRLALETSQESVLDALLSALKTRDTEPQGHTERVTAYTMEIAGMLAIPPGVMYHIERGALLHDIGKVGISDRILLKPEKLTAEEWAEMRRHPVIGYEMCAKIEMLRQSAQIVQHHHERWDGTGYPVGLKGQAIPIGARIFAIADALDAMTSDRPYRAAGSFTAARQEILRCAGKQFDPTIVRAFLTISEARLEFIRSNAAK
jgi:response regulator RpfG family c-di-GMP phosphodiesterase